MAGLQTLNPFISVEDSGICVDPDFFRDLSDVPKSVIIDAVEQSMAPSKNALCGDPSSAVLGPLQPVGRQYFDAISGLKRRLLSEAPGTVGGAMTSLYGSTAPAGAPASPYGAAASTASAASPYGAAASPYGATPAKATTSPYGAPTSPYGATTGSASPYGATAAPSSPYGATTGASSSPYGAISAVSSYGAPPTAASRPPTRRDGNPFSFLRDVSLPFDVIQQIGLGDRPVILSAFLHRDVDGHVQMAADYRQASMQYRRELPAEDVRMFAAAPGYVQPDMQQAGEYGMMQWASMRERYKTAIRDNDHYLGRTTPAAVDDLTLPQLIAYHARQQSDLIQGMNMWFYNNGILIASNAISGSLNGQTGIRILDHYANMHSLSGRIRDLKAEPWWNYSLRQVSQGSSIGGSPGMALAMMVAMSVASSSLDGIAQYTAKQKEEAAKLLLEGAETETETVAESEPVEKAPATAAAARPLAAAARPTAPTTESAARGGGEPASRPLIRRQPSRQVPRAAEVDSKRLKDLLSTGGLPLSTGETPL